MIALEACFRERRTTQRLVQRFIDFQSAYLVS
jgi:hypothetical protein